MECPVCYESFNGSFTVSTPCGHKICLSCFVNLKKIKCPMCRDSWRDKLPLSYAKFLARSIGYLITSSVRKR